jgi:hypothetical protein
MRPDSWGVGERPSRFWHEDSQLRSRVEFRRFLCYDAFVAVKIVAFAGSNATCRMLGWC